MLENIKLEPILDSVKKIQMDDSEYFALDAVSNSKLSLLNPDQGGSPQKFFIEGFKGGSSAMELGSAVHQLLLEKDKYFLSEFEKPGGKVGPIIKLVHDLTMRESNPMSFDDALETACKVHDYYSTSLSPVRLASLKEKGMDFYNYLTEESEPGKIVLTAEQRDKCLKCVGSIKANKYAYELLYPETSETLLSFNEDALFMDMLGVIPDDVLDDEVTIKMKAKIDNWSIDFDTNIITLNDLKTTGKFIQFFAGRKSIPLDPDDERPIFIEGSFQHYRYYRQMAKLMALILEIV